MPPLHKNLPDLIKNKMFPSSPLIASFPSLHLFPSYHVSRLVMFLIYITVCLFNCQGLAFILVLCTCVCVSVWV